MSSWKRVCCAIDFSEPSRVAMLEAAHVAARSGASLTLLHVHEAPDLSGEGVAAPPEVFARAEAELQRQLSLWAREAAEASGVQVATSLLSGKTAPEIVGFAGEHRVDLLVMATHGRSGVRRLVLGSVAERVVRSAPCSVLVVRPGALGAAELAGAPRVRDLMSPRPASARPDATLQEAARQMRALAVGALPICDEAGHPLGMLTDRDIVIRCVAEGSDPAREQVRGAMSPQLIACREDDPLPAAAQVMARALVRRLLVLDAAERLVGILSVDDLARAERDAAAQVLAGIVPRG